jgi:hypothetical protein
MKYGRLYHSFGRNEYIFVHWTSLAAPKSPEGVDGKALPGVA